MRELGRRIAGVDRFPLRQVFGAGYALATRLLKARLDSLPAVRAVYLSGSYASGRQVHGASDIDFFVLVDGAFPETVQQVETTLKSLLAVFPFLGPLAERMDQVVLTEPDGTLSNPLLMLRHLAGQLRPLLVRPGFVPEFAVPNELALLAEARLQLRLVLSRVRDGQDDGYFWRRRHHALDGLLSVAGLPALGEDPMKGWPDRELLGRDLAGDACLALFVGGLERLHTCLLETPRESKPVEVSRRGHWPSLETDPGQPTRARLRDLPDSSRLSLGGFAVTLGEPPLLLSPLETPWAFQNDPAPRLGVSLWKWTLGAAGRELERLRSELAAGDERLLANDRRIASLPLDVHRLVGVRPRELVVYSDDQAVLEDLRCAYPTHGEFWDSLRNVLAGDEPALAHSNFFGFAVAFAGALANGQEVPPPDLLRKRLRLSLCIVTRDRVAWLEALLGTVCAQLRQPDQVVVVDNSPKASARALVAGLEQRLPLHYVHQPQGKLGALRSLAVEQSDGELICFTDDDCLLPPDWLAQAERSFLRDPRIGAVGGAVRHFPEFDGPIDRFHRLYLGV